MTSAPSAAPILFRPPAYVVFGVDSPPSRFTLLVQAHSNRRYPTSSPTGEPAPAGFVPCRPDRPPRPPDSPVDRDAHLAANTELFAGLPLPRGVRVVSNNLETGTAMGNGMVPVGYVSSWRLVPSSGVDACGLAEEFEAAMAAAGWERFSWQAPSLRTSWFFDPPRSVELELAPDGAHTILVSGNGAVVGTRQYPGDRTAFEPGATPESRGEPIACTFG